MDQTTQDALPPSRRTRRSFLTGALATAAAVAAVRPALAQSSVFAAQEAMEIPNRDTNLKFYPNGAERIFAGNTVICHLPAQCRMRDALTDLHVALAGSVVRHKIGLTAPASYHMTIYSGADSLTRRPSNWPSYVPITASIEACNQAVYERMQKALLHAELPIRVMVDVPYTERYPLATTMRMKGADASEEAKLRSIRRQLAPVIGIALPEPDHYEFHITLAYQLEKFTAAEEQQYRALLREHVARIVAAQPVLELGNPEYCTFRTMDRFEPLKLIRTV